MGKDQVSIYRIAKEAGVSPATVSRVLTNHANVSTEKRMKVEALIKKYDFIPNAMARGLSNTKSGMIGLLTTDIRNPFYAEVAIHCERYARANGYVLMLSNSLNDSRIEEHHLEKMFEQRVDALILLGGKVDQMNSDEAYVTKLNHMTRTVPVIINGKLDGGNCYRVNIDEGAGLELLMEYLIAKGHKRICMLGGDRNQKPTYEKRARYKICLNKFGLPFRPEYIRETGEYSVESGYEEMNQLLDSQIELPDVVMAINDFTAMGVVRSIREHGLEIPKDIAVASFDNTYIAESITPKLTSISYNYKLLGKKLVETAIQTIQGNQPEKLQMVAPSLVIRESTELN